MQKSRDACCDTASVSVDVLYSGSHNPCTYHEFCKGNENLNLKKRLFSFTFVLLGDISDKHVLSRKTIDNFFYGKNMKGTAARSYCKGIIIDSGKSRIRDM